MEDIAREISLAVQGCRCLGSVWPCSISNQGKYAVLPTESVPVPGSLEVPRRLTAHTSPKCRCSMCRALLLLALEQTLDWT